MSRTRSLLAGVALVAILAMAPGAVRAQSRPYIGYAYPAGGQQGTTIHVKLGGQLLDGVDAVRVTGEGVTGRLVSYERKINPQDMQLVREQLQELRKAQPRRDRSKAAPVLDLTQAPVPLSPSEAPEVQMTRIERRINDYVQRPASAALVNLAWVELTIAPGAAPGPREIRLVTPRGVTNPLVFHVGTLPEVSRIPMKTANFQILGKEELALRTRPADQVEQRCSLPCTLNGQIASGEVNRYRFEARKGQRLVITTQARSLIPYLADAVPGWIQPILSLQSASGEPLAYNDDYLFRPDPVILFEVPVDGEYVLAINDALYRGREDFVYRISLGELPFVTSRFPLGGPAGTAGRVELQGWNLGSTSVTVPATVSEARGVKMLEIASKEGTEAAQVLYAVDTLPETLVTESAGGPQKVTLPVIANGRLEAAGDRDEFAFEGKAGETVVAEVLARRLESPVDSRLWLTDASGKILAFSDDTDDLAAGVNTFQADSCLSATLPSDGTYRVILTDASGGGGDAYAYRLRLSAPRPDFELRAVPSSLALRGRASGTVEVHVVRRDGFNTPIQVSLADPPQGFTATKVTLEPDKASVRLNVRTSLEATAKPVRLKVQGRAEVEGLEIVHEAVPAEDRMQAFLWRHLVPAADLPVVVLDAGGSTAAQTKRKGQGQVAGRIRQIQLLQEEGLLTAGFAKRKIAEYEESVKSATTK
jgi:hypothetical protein